MSPKKWLTTAELARYLSCSQHKLKDDRVKGIGIPFSRFGRLIRYDLHMVDRYLEAQSEPHEAAA